MQACGAAAPVSPATSGHPLACLDGAVRRHHLRGGCVRAALRACGRLLWGAESSHGGIGLPVSCFALDIAWALFSVGGWMRIRPCVGVGAGQCRSRFRVRRVGRSVHLSISVCLLKGCLTLGFAPAHWRCEAARRFCSLLRCRAVRCAPPGPALWARRVRALHAYAALIPCLVASVGVVRSRGTR
jgi:hypothetical protein